MLAPVEEALAEGTVPAYADLAARILPQQEAAIPLGRAVWSFGLSMQGFSQDAYDQLLDISSSYLEDVQAGGLAAVETIAADDVDLGREVAVAGAAMEVWLSGYFTGMMDSGADLELPVVQTD